MLKYIIGFLKNFFNPAVSFVSQIDHLSKVHTKARVYGLTKLFNSTIDKYSYVGRNSTIVCADIGKFCSISNDVVIGMGIHPLRTISTSPLFISKRNGTSHSWTNEKIIDEYQRVSIGHDVWIGSKVIVMGGVKIGNGAVVGCGAIVTKDIPDYGVAVGVPAQIIKYRFEPAMIEVLQKLQWWDFPETKLKYNISVFQKHDITESMLNQLQ
ncbi:MAG: CatB-related O-acetyltransferase [Bacteroidales bacterium]|jgi:acetyltransferase-like isoleucine patch superfamily enzyme|nr:CatB-related O-acetyltransferase [Bacteroidales bacterium]